MQGAYLLSRTDVGEEILRKIEKLFEQELNPYVQVALSTVLVQRRRNNEEIVRKLFLHPNEKVSDIGKLFRSVKNEDSIASARLKHMFRSEAKWLLCDNMVFVHLMAASNNSRIRERLLNTIREPRCSHPVTGLRLP
jgi:hypothetical protein